jgi:tRNA dimethylallyltransferase
MNKKVICIIGPTGSGKSDVAYELAKILNTEIINCDVFQMYKHFNIGTNKPPVSVLSSIKHHFIDNLEVNDNYSIYEYQSQGRQVIDSLLASNKVPIIVGGSFLYLNSLIYDYHLQPNNPKAHSFDHYSLVELQELVKKLNVDLPANFDYNNPRRLTRLLETDGNLSFTSKNDHPLIYDCLFIRLVVDRDELKLKTDKRIETMFNNGWIEEVKSLASKYESTCLPFRAIGYLDILSYLNKESSLELTLDRIKIKTHKYIRRQETWLNNQYKNTHNFLINNLDFISEILTLSNKFVSS